MNIYKQLNECISYIEENISNEIDYNHISKIFGCNISTVQRVFSLITGMTLTEYIRRRRLTVAVYDIKNNERIIDVALKYGYSQEVSFSRSFKKMHGVLPSKVRNNNITCTMQPVLKFNENKIDNNLSYRIENIDNFSLYGIKEEVDISNIPVIAEKLWEDIKIKCSEFKTNSVRYGVIREENNKYYYYCTLETKLDNFEKIDIPKSKWIVFECKSYKGDEIKKLFKTAFDRYLPSVGFYSKNMFLEKYGLDYVEIYIMID